MWRAGQNRFPSKEQTIPKYTPQEIRHIKTDSGSTHTYWARVLGRPQIFQKKQTIDYSNENEIKFEVDNKGYIVKTTIPKEEYFPHRDIFDAAIKFLAKGPVYEMQNNKDRFITVGFKNTKEVQDSIISKAATSLGFVSKYPS